MSLTISLLAGILSSIVAVIIIELYRQIRKRYDHRVIRRITGFADSTCTIIVPAFPIESPSTTGLISVSDAIALAYVLEICSMVKCKANVMSMMHIEDNSLASSIISIGGPSGNEVTGSLLKNYCPGFHVRNSSDYSNTYYECGDERFTRDTDTSIAFIVRLASQHTQLPGTVLLLWGHFGIDTNAAAFFLREYPTVLAGLQRDSFFVALSLNLSLGYRSVSKSIIDLSNNAFNPEQFDTNSRHERA
jgi:hypothetical protein